MLSNDIPAGIIDVKRKIYQYIQQGVIEKDVIDCLYKDGYFLAKESELWDYKSDIEDTSDIALSKIVKLIAAFHNTYGGYIVYGVEETEKDKVFSPVYFDESKLKPAQLSSLIISYLGMPIDITMATHTINKDGVGYNVTLVHVPKRLPSSNPLKFIKKSPAIKKPNNKITHVFLPEDTVIRNNDRSEAATTVEEWKLLLSSRDYYSNISNVSNISMTHNLPDKSLIYNKFIGRKHIILSLWAWLSDNFEYTKVLAGDGGKGKTSIAYRFCQELLESQPSKFERVLWLSAKEKRFSGQQNQIYDLDQVDFTDFNSFLLSIADNYALDSDELSSTSIKNIKQSIKLALPIFPSLIVIDNVDSLTQDEQQRIVEFCVSMGSDISRFLITTRNRFSYSEELCFEVPGLDKNDYDKYVDETINALKIKDSKITAKQKNQLYQATDGSPLLTQSILRLYKLGDKLEAAIHAWKGQTGEDARNFSLRREIDGLSKDAQRTLLSICYFDSCSKSELLSVCGLQNTKLNDAIVELQSLFLVNEPKFIKDENRFSLSMTTKLLALSIEKDLVSDYQKLRLSIQKFREGFKTLGKKGNTQRVGLAISQAIALIKEGRFDDAEQTIENEIKRQPHNPDLLLAKARCIIQSPTPNFEKARVILKSSYDNGQRKEMLFDFWFNCENNLESIHGQIEVARLALGCKYSAVKWNNLLAHSLILRSNYRSGIDKINDLVDASNCYQLIIKNQKNKSDEHENSIKFSYQLHDKIWSILESETSIGWLESFKIIQRLIEHGDIRTGTYKYAERCIIEATAESMRKPKENKALIIAKEKYLKLIKSSNNPHIQHLLPTNDI
ncbi:RNA-binding domain-containing protein [Providencia stuartii]|uniref:RNA-binding domain-containing protein n=1 Tax=Providencia stuartii TaxID=588 RepID=UPI0018C46261|nr:RNA-binding domain-containing protein [Providencia stuartii]MBG5918950.1 putative DNA binding domain-containing protein [Providencia stuartii]